MAPASRPADAVPPEPLPAEAQAAVLAWYAGRGRELPFRGTKDPYAVLVSELMAQQTQVARAAEAWRGFLAGFPSFASLAAASPAEVVRAWRGLGYNRRALALRRIAIAVVEEHDGRLPDDVATLEALPGIGPYTARAVAALAFGRTVGPVDTNVRRVLSRAVLGLDPAREAGAARLAPAAFQRLADAAVPPGRGGEWTHALMDIGAVVCRARSPRCADCPLRPWCRYARAGRGVEAADAGAARKRPGRGSDKPAAGPFTSTSRWLRGRIVERLCDAPDGEWVDLDERIGEHGPEALAVSLASLARDGLAELHPTVPRRARLPVT